jgi:RNA polymerase sigma factor (sigma-70 family)
MVLDADHPGRHLVGLALAGDRDAFSRLVQPHLGPALGAARLITGGESDAADAVQDALLLAWQRLGQLREPAAFPAWFRQIVVRSSVQIAKSRHRLSELDSQASAPIDDLERAFDLRMLARAIERVDLDDRLVLTLHFFWALPIAETGRLIGVPEGTVKSRVHHAVRRLRAAYDAEGRR